jgi:hypothetical protein
MSLAEIVRRESLLELRKLGGWFRSRHGLTIILLGGWAVYSYNPYVGSYDIDCLGPTDPFTLQLNIYMKQNGYLLEPESPFGAATECWRKPVVVGNTEIESIYIDACDFAFKNVFKEDPRKEIPYHLCTKKEFLRPRQISGEYFYVPIKELLFLYKAKAARDREYLLVNTKMPSAALVRLQGKRDKDYSDLVALLDPTAGGWSMDGFVLGNLVREHDISFIVGTISSISDHSAARDYCIKRSIEISEIRRWVAKVIGDSGL